MKKQIYFFIGTNAEFFKLAPIIREFKLRKISVKIISSGQNNLHFEQIERFSLVKHADIALGPKINRVSVLLFFIWTIKTFLLALFKLRTEFSTADKKRSYFIIHGDTITSTMGAFIAKLYGFKLVHIESGYLSFNFLEPFPEEICRNINIRLADILFCPNTQALSNLEKLKKDKINTKLNTIVETLNWALRYNNKKDQIVNNKYFVFFLHRQEHVIFKKTWSKSIMEFVINNAPKNLTCVIIDYPITVSLLREINLRDKVKNIKIIPPLPYLDFMKLLKGSEFIATDGCTLQEESYFIGKPFLALRNLTERSEGLGHNVVIAKSKKSTMRNFFKNYKQYRKNPLSSSNRPSKTIVDYLLKIR